MLQAIRERRNRVLVTGVGAVTPLAPTAEESWSQLLLGQSGIGPITSFDVSDLPTKIGGEIRRFEISDYLPRNVSRRMDSYAQYAVAAAAQAVESAKLQVETTDSTRVGVVIGTGYGPVRSNHEVAAILQEKGPRGISPLSQVMGAHDSAAGEVSLLFGAKGPTRAISTACATGTDAIGEAARLIQLGVCDVVIAGGADNCLTRVDFAGTGKAGALSTRNDHPELASRPFDAARDGFVMSAGAGVVVLESADHAIERGASGLAEFAGYAATSDAHHWTAPHPQAEGARRAMVQALADAELQPTELDYVNAHGTSTSIGDERELWAIRQVLGEHAERVPISATKSMTGHMIGASGAVELISCVLAIRDGIVPPTVNLIDPIDSALNLVPQVAQKLRVSTAMSNSFGFGGHNAVAVLKRWSW
ncbi:beta-ketoacyl-ACP synthase II [Nakamurella aerolata]|uniref:3-oxoacyl-[acyl-carrier-protein] synthase 2 n=1 Tax=Nakamurella aerolata TaxID=1656892 RepID=A0A849AAS9_9ACTN|nr:beta-ketoacyl-ACP synthase II [Nakamurella aerolata]NNG36686.1 beta-ketoacyl-ACP synthase II [Nakamurella aerolata]